MRWAVAIIAVAVLLDTAWTPVQAASPKRTAHVDPALLAQAKANPNAIFEVIVEAAAPTTQRELQQRQRGQFDSVDRAGKAVKRTGDKPRRSLGIVGGTSAKVRGSNILTLANDPDVAYIYADAPLQSKFDPLLIAPLVTEPGQLEVNAPAVWTQYGVIGRGVGVAIVDSGIYPHADLAGRVVAAIDFTSASPVALASATPTATPVPLASGSPVVAVASATPTASPVVAVASATPTASPVVAVASATPTASPVALAPDPLASATPVASPVALASPSPVASPVALAPDPLASATPVASPVALASPSPVALASASPVSLASPSPVALASPSPVALASASPVSLASPSPVASLVALGDPGGHGTHVAGLVAGDGTSSRGAYTGVAPGANLVDVRVIDANGHSSVSTVLAGLQWVLKNRATYNIRVVNLSLGAQEQTSYKLSPLSTAVEVLSFAGVTVVVSAGNGGPGAGTITTPGDDPFVVTVGAIDDAGTSTIADDTSATWSSCGPTTFDGLAKPDLVAPGRHMISLRSPGSTLDTLYPLRQVTAPGAVTPAYFMLSGTSMAAPLVTGAVALMLEKDPTLNPRQIKQRLISGVTPLSFGTTMTRGAGMLNALTSVGSTDRTGWSDASRVSDGFAKLVFPLIAGQTLHWRDLTFNGGLDSMGVRWADVTWTNITWNDITWTDITWTDIIWDGIIWDGVAAQDIIWDMALDPLSGSGPGWAPLD